MHLSCDSCRSDAEHAIPRRPGRTRKHVACAVSCLPIRKYESSIRITLTYEKLVKRLRAGSPGCGAGNENLSLLGRGRRLDAAHIYQCVRVSFPPSPLIPPPDLHLVSFASAALRRRLRPRGADILVQFSCSRRIGRLNKLAAIDKPTLAHHVAGLPKTRQTRPTSPSTPRATAGSSTRWVKGILGG